MIRKGKFAWLLCLALFLPSPVGADVPHDNYRRCESPYGDLPYVMNQLPDSEDPWEQYDEATIRHWRRFDSVLEWSEFPSMPTGDWTYDYRNDIIGLVSDNELESVTGYGWPSGAAGMCITSIYSYSDCIAFTDIVVNSEYDWTTDFFESMENDYTLYYQDVLLHELGHTFGLDDYDYSGGAGYPDSIGYNTVMNYYYPWVGVLGLDDGMTIQKMYPDFKENITDIGVYYFYCDSQTNCPKIQVRDASIDVGDKLAVDGIQVANLGNTEETDVEVEVRLIDTEKHQQIYPLGSFVVSRLPSRSNKLVDVEIKVPATVPSGRYYLAFAVEHETNYQANNTSISPTKITVSGGVGDDDDDDVLDDDDNDNDNRQQLCNALMSLIYDNCGLSVFYLGVLLDYQAALSNCYQSGFPVSCLNECWRNPDVDDCNSLQACFAGMCGFAIQSSSADDDGDDEDDDDDDDGACGC